VEPEGLLQEGLPGRARVLDIGNKAFPSEIYTIRKYPGLRR
jgi:hypothetical protein